MKGQVTHEKIGKTRGSAACCAERLSLSVEFIYFRPATRLAQTFRSARVPGRPKTHTLKVCASPTTGNVETPGKGSAFPASAKKKPIKSLGPAGSRKAGGFPHSPCRPVGRSSCDQKVSRGLTKNQQLA